MKTSLFNLLVSPELFKLLLFSLDLAVIYILLVLKLEQLSVFLGSVSHELVNLLLELSSLPSVLIGLSIVVSSSLVL